MKTFAKIMVAAIVALFMACVLIMHDASDRVVIVTYFATAIGVSAVLGVFEMPEERKHTSIRDAARDYDRAA